MAPIVYCLSALTSLTCVILLLRAYFRTRSRILMWSGVCFLGLAVNNVLLVFDLVILPAIDLQIPRLLAAAFGLFVLAAALIWESV